MLVFLLLVTDPDFAEQIGSVTYLTCYFCMCVVQDGESANVITVTDCAKVSDSVGDSETGT